MPLSAAQKNALTLLTARLSAESQELQNTNLFIQKCMQIIQVISAENPKDVITDTEYTDEQITKVITLIQTKVDTRFPMDI